MYAPSATTATTGTNHARPKLATIHSCSPARIDPAWLATARSASRPARISNTPTISRTWRCVRCGRLDRLERADLDREDEARRAPVACEREPRELVRRMLVCRRTGLRGFYTRPFGRPSTRRPPGLDILLAWRSTPLRMPRPAIASWSRSAA